MIDVRLISIALASKIVIDGRKIHSPLFICKILLRDILGDEKSGEHI